MQRGRVTTHAWLHKSAGKTHTYTCCAAGNMDHVFGVCPVLEQDKRHEITTLAPLDFTLTVSASA